MKTLFAFLIIALFSFEPLFGQEKADFPMMPSNYYVGNSSYALKKGQAYYTNTWIFFNDFYYGVTDNVSVGTGMIPLFLLGGLPTPVWIKAKAAFPVIENKFNVSAGLVSATILFDDEFGYSLSFFTGFTAGSPRNNVSFNYYFTGVGNEDNIVFMDGDAHIFSLSGRLGITPRSFIMADNLIFVYSGTILSLSIVGLQTLFHGLILDYGLLIPLGMDMDTFYGLPYLGVKIPFGFKK